MANSRQPSQWLRPMPLRARHGGGGGRGADGIGSSGECSRVS